MPGRNNANMPQWAMVAAVVAVAGLVVAALVWAMTPGIKEGYRVNCTNWFGGVIKTGQSETVTLPGNRYANTKIVTLATRAADGKYHTKVHKEANDVFDSYPGGLWHAKVGDVYRLPIAITPHGVWGCEHTDYSTGKPIPGRSKPSFVQLNCAQEPGKSNPACYWYPGSKYYTGPDATT
jgi:hypothetical protein